MALKTKFLDWEQGEFEVIKDKFSCLRLITKKSEYWLMGTPEKIKPCMICKKPALLLDLYSEGYICSKKCEEKWVDYLAYAESLGNDD